MGTVKQTILKPVKYCSEISLTGSQFLTRWPITYARTRSHTHAHAWGHESGVDIRTCRWAWIHGDPECKFPCNNTFICDLCTLGLTWKPVICVFHPQHVSLLMTCTPNNFSLMEYLRGHGDLTSDGALRSTDTHTHYMEHARSLWCWILESWINATSLCDVACSKIYQQWLICTQPLWFYV